MAWGTLRQATEEDEARLNAAAQRFANKHLPDWARNHDGIDDLEDIMAYVTDDESGCPQLYRLWMAAVHRALRHPGADGIAYGYVGYWAP